MSNSMKDLLLGLGFKPAPPPPREERERPASRPERTDVSRDPNQRHSSERHPSQRPSNPRPSDQRPSNQRPSSQRPSNQRPSSEGSPQQRDATPASAHATQRPRPEQGARIERPRRDPPPQRTREEIDLAKAYAIRAQKEKDERIEAERLKQEAARIKRESKAKVAELLKDKSLNAADAEHVRHFDYNGKIRRVHVTDTQLKSLNRGDLGVVQLDGRYLLVDAALAREASTLLPSLLALLVDPNAPAVDDPYADPQYRVPDDLVW